MHPLEQVLRGFLHRTTVPILVKKGELYGMLGNGALYRDDSGSYLITAAHVATEVQSTTSLLGIPTGPPPSQVLTLGRGVLVGALNEDVAVLRLDQPELVRALETSGHFRFLDRSNLAVDFGAGGFVLLGYPAAETGIREGSDRLSSVGKVIEARWYDGPLDAVSVTVGPHDLLLEWKDRDANLRGISGTPIWAILPGSALGDGVWSTEQSLGW